jgi:predicted nicotinamide N-methyase
MDIGKDRTDAPTTLSTAAGELSLDEYRLGLAGHRWTILHTRAILSQQEENRFLLADEPRPPYGVILWPSAIALAHELAGRPMRGVSVLELGAGIGLPGIVAATLGARVVQTDNNAAALDVARKNAERNRASLEQRAGDWTEWHETGSHDLIIGADILYADSLYADLLHIFETNLAPGGRILIADPFRPTTFELLEDMAADGWDITFSKWTVGIVPPLRSIGIFELKRAVSARAGGASGDRDGQAPP